MLIRRGAIVIAGERSRLGSKPRPWLVIQSDSFNATHHTITACMVSTSAEPAALFRISVAPDEGNGLQQTSLVLIDAMISLSRRSIDAVAGQLAEEKMAEVDKALRYWLDL